MSHFSLFCIKEYTNIKGGFPSFNFNNHTNINQHKWSSFGDYVVILISTLSTYRHWVVFGVTFSDVFSAT